MNQVPNTTSIGQAPQRGGIQTIAASLVKNAGSFVQMLESSLHKSTDSHAQAKPPELDLSSRWKANDEALTHMDDRHNNDVTEEKYSSKQEVSQNQENTRSSYSQESRSSNNVENRNEQVPVVDNSEPQPIALFTSMDMSSMLNGLNGSNINSLKTGSGTIDNTPQIIQKQVFSKLTGSNLLMTGKGTLKLSLTPPHLGKVEALFEKNGQKLSITLKVESSAAAQALKDGSPELANIISNKCQEWDEVTVNIEIEEDEDLQEDNQSQHRDENHDDNDNNEGAE